jgi:hypothetical protein
MSQVLDTWSPKESVRDPSENGCALNAENRNTNPKNVKGRVTAQCTGQSASKVQEGDAAGCAQSYSGKHDTKRGRETQKRSGEKRPPKKTPRRRAQHAPTRNKQ